MDKFNASRRDVLKLAGVAGCGLAGVSSTSPSVAGHPSIDASATDLLETIQVPADAAAGFNYPFYLYVPETSQEDPVPMLVEPNNTGTSTDDFEKHRRSAKQLSQGGLGWTRLFSEALTVPLLVPVFPRPRGDPVPGDHYVHALDETTMNLDGGPLERVDLQLANMIERARELLRDMSYPVADEVLLNGFSASGNFVNRFTALHPELVRSVTAGGVNGTLVLPLEEAKGHTLDYHIGIADVNEVTGEPFDKVSWQDVAQFIYMGGEDENDTIPYDDAWSDEQRRIALDVYGEDMQNDRMPYCESVYEDAGANARFEIYEGVGHRIPLEIQEDIVDFHWTRGELKRISFAAQPTAGDSSLRFETDLIDDRSELEVRARSDEHGDITATPTTIRSGESTGVDVALETTVANGETVSGLVLPAGETDPENAIASVDRVAVELPTVEVLSPPSASTPSITVRYGVKGSYQADTSIHLYLAAGDAGSRQLLDTFEPGAVRSEAYDVGTEDGDVPLEDGSQLQVIAVDVDTRETIARDAVTVGDGEKAESPVSVSFDEQPTAGQTDIDVQYSVNETYEPSAVLTLQLHVGEDIDVLLGALEPGDATTDAFSVEGVPFEGGSEIDVRIVDGDVLDRDRTVVVDDANDLADVHFSKRPTESDPTAAIEYQVDETYTVRDALTVRVYGDGVPGAVPGKALSLVSPGERGTTRFTVDDADPAAVELEAAIVDHVPLAVASTTDELGDSYTDQSTESDDGSNETTERPTTERSTTERPTTERSTTERPTTGESNPTEPASDQPTSVRSTTDQSPNQRESEETAEGGSPGFGVASAVASAGGLSYVLKRRLDDSRRDAEAE